MGVGEAKEGWEGEVVCGGGEAKGEEEEGERGFGETEERFDVFSRKWWLEYGPCSEFFRKIFCHSFSSP